MNDKNFQLEEFYNSVQEKTELFRCKCEDAWSGPIENSWCPCQYFYFTDEYLNSAIKVMIVGKATNGWFQDPSWTVKQAMEATKEFLYKDNCAGSFFWRFSWEFESLMNGEKPFGKFNVFYSNMFRISNDAEPKDLYRHPELVEEYLDAVQSLSHEIRIASPDVLLFLTGPDYDTYLMRIFRGVRFEKASAKYSERELARLVHESLPVNTFRLYHPNYANRDKVHLWENLLPELRNLINGQDSLE